VKYKAIERWFSLIYGKPLIAPAFMPWWICVHFVNIRAVFQRHKWTTEYSVKLITNMPVSLYMKYVHGFGVCQCVESMPYLFCCCWSSLRWCTRFLYARLQINNGVLIMIIMIDVRITNQTQLFVTDFVVRKICLHNTEITVKTYFTKSHTILDHSLDNCQTKTIFFNKCKTQNTVYSSRVCLMVLLVLLNNLYIRSNANPFCFKANNI